MLTFIQCAILSVILELRDVSAQERMNAVISMIMMADAYKHAILLIMFKTSTA